MENKLIYYLSKWTKITKEESKIIQSAFKELSIKKKKDLLVEGMPVNTFILL